MAGHTRKKYHSYNSLIVKYDADGILLWMKSEEILKSVFIKDVKADSDNNYVAVGYEFSSTASIDKALIAKFDTNGNLVWQKKLGDGSHDVFYATATDSTDSYIAVGKYTNSDKETPTIVKFSTDTLT